MSGGPIGPSGTGEAGPLPAMSQSWEHDPWWSDPKGPPPATSPAEAIIVEREADEPCALDALEGHVVGRHLKKVFCCWTVIFSVVGAQNGLGAATLFRQRRPQPALCLVRPANVELLRRRLDGPPPTFSLKAIMFQTLAAGRWRAAVPALDDADRHPGPDAAGGGVFAFGFLYGAAMGSYGGVGGDRVWQLLYSGLKVPVLLLATFLIGLPNFFVLNTLFGLLAATSAKGYARRSR